MVTVKELAEERMAQQNYCFAYNSARDWVYNTLRKNNIQMVKIGRLSYVDMSKDEFERIAYARKADIVQDDGSLLASALGYNAGNIPESTGAVSKVQKWGWGL